MHAHASPSNAPSHRYELLWGWLAFCGLELLIKRQRAAMILANRGGSGNYFRNAGGTEASWKMRGIRSERRQRLIRIRASHRCSELQKGRRRQFLFHTDPVESLRLLAIPSDSNKNGFSIADSTAPAEYSISISTYY